MYRRSGYRRSSYRRGRSLAYGRGYQSSTKSRVSLRVPVTEVFSMAFNSNYTNTFTPGTPGTYVVAKAAGNTTRVGSICPWLYLSDTSVEFTTPGSGEVGHPNLPSASRAVFPQAHCPAVAKKIYQTYCDLYDEVKLDQMQVTLSILDPLGSATFPSMSIATGWDRKACYNEVMETYDWRAARVPAINNAAAYPATQAAHTYPLIISRDYPASYDALVSGPAASEATAINNSVAKVFRYVKASDLLERNTFHDSTLMPYDGNGIVDQAYGQSTTDVKGLGFCPVFYFAVKLMGANAADGASVNIQAEVNYYFTFRNPKFGGDVFAGSAAANRQADLRIGASLNAAAIAAAAAAPAAVAAQAPAQEVADDDDGVDGRAHKRSRTGSVILETPDVTATQTADSSTGTMDAGSQAAVVQGEESIINEETRLA